MDYTGQGHDDISDTLAAESAGEAPAPAVRGLGIADVLFPATPPVPVNARLVRGFCFHDEAKPRGLARSAGLFRSTWDEPDQHGPRPGHSSTS